MTTKEAQYRRALIKIAELTRSAQGFIPNDNLESITGRYLDAIRAIEDTLLSLEDYDLFSDVTEEGGAVYVGEGLD